MQERLPIEDIQTQLENLRERLIHRPATFSLENCGQLLEKLGRQLNEVRNALGPERRISQEERRQLSEILGLSQRVSALYEQALVLYAPPY